MSERVAAIGLEVHCRLRTRTKMFSACPQGFGAAPNRQVDAYTLGLPGSLPTVNARAVELAIRFALAVGAEVAAVSRWDRKHYFYPDLPKGYQITQAAEPYARGGAIAVGDREVPLLRIHLEEDAGKSVHDGDESLVDFNRAGAPLLEVVGAPALTSPAEAAAWLRELRALVRALAVSDADMEEGSLRCDANVSLAPPGAPLGVRCEIKNVNSFRALERAIAAEIRRQSEILGAGGEVVPTTLRWDADAGRVAVLRAKEAAADYRYLPEPDLPPLRIDRAWVDRVRDALPELPRARRARWAALGVAARDAAVLADDPALAAYFDAALAAAGAGEARRVAAWLLVELLGTGRPLAALPPEDLAALVGLRASGALTGPQAKEVLARCLAEGRRPGEIAGEFAPERDEAALTAAVAAVLAAHPEQVARCLAGRAGAAGDRRARRSGPGS
jgi:aspartyl-tRNA(Asn)/glutamyl-tRNA(Gln) amidotransferase subunit B